MRRYLLVAFSITAIALLVSLEPAQPNDLWWHVRVGQLIAQTGAIPQTQQLAWAVPADTAYVYGAWLGELLLYSTYRAGSIELLEFMRNLLAAATLGLVALEARRRIGSWRFVGLAVCFAGVLLLTNVTVRPQIWAWVPFALFLLILGRYADGSLRPIWLGALPVLMVFWVNVHGSFVLGGVLVACYLGGAVLQRFNEPPGSRNWESLLPLGTAAVVTALAMLANPRGIGIVSYAADVAGSPQVRTLISEWQPPSPLDPFDAPFFISILALLVVASYARQRPRPADVLLLVGFLWLAWSAGRNVAWYGIVAMPMLVESLARLRPVKVPAAAASRPPVALITLVGFTACALVL